MPLFIERQSESVKKVCKAVKRVSFNTANAGSLCHKNS